MSVQRPESRLEAAKPKKEKITYETIKQGVEQLYPPDDSTNATNIDVVFVPGLGANPKESWKSTTGPFNWASDKNGIAKDYPNARVLLHLYESAFHGALKVDQFLDNIALGLLHALQAKRGDQFNRPLVFIGHSMGGLVIAKAVTLMDSRRDTFRKMFEATAGCIFFGSPFNGAQAASVAAMFSIVGERFNQTTTSKLLDLMKPGEPALRELKDDFMRLVSKMSPRIELYCLWENHDTDIAKMLEDFLKRRDPTGGRVSGAFYELFKRAQKPIKVVERESATLDGVDHLGLACNHRDLVKFDDFKDARYQTIRDPLKKIIHGAPLVAKNRLNSTRDVDLEAIKSLSEALESFPVTRKRKNLIQTYTSSSWLPTEAEFTQWLAKDEDPHDETDRRRGDSLWICGAEGRGKTGAMIAALEEVEKAIKDDVHRESGKPPILLAYYFCEPASDFSTAEELLKSLLWQLIQKQPLYVSYAKQFTKRERRQPVPTSVENLWQSLQDMLSDDTASSRVYFVINNLHTLSAESDSTKKLMDFIRLETVALNDDDANKTSTRWMFTSRRSKKSIEEVLNVDGVRLIDLEDNKYANQVQLELRKHAQKKVSMLGEEKGYKKDLAYFVSSLIGNRAQNTGWIDLTCGQLQEIPEAESALKVRQTLRSVPQDLDELLNEGWRQIFSSNPDKTEKLKEMLQALVITYEEPTLLELAVLAGFPEDDGGTAELRELVELCTSFLVLKGKPEAKVYFKNVIVKPHLLRHAHKLLGITEDEIKWLHGELALRSFLHIMERFEVSPPDEHEEGTADVGATAGDDSASNIEGRAAESESEEESEDEDDDDEDDDEDSDSDATSDLVELEFTALPYMVTHWLHHASKATAEMAENLSKEEEFWKPKSYIRGRWLDQYESLTKAYDGLDHKSMSALHVAASIGFRQLVSALMRNGYEKELDLYDSMQNTPLHLAAFFGRPNIVEELIYRGASVDRGKTEMASTPLAMAAYKGAVNVMKMILAAGADPNAIDDDTGPVLNASIYSGSPDAVKLLMERGVTLSFDGDVDLEELDFEPPLSQAARLPDSCIFDYIMEAGVDALSPHDYDTAFVAAADAGNAEIFRKLLGCNHDTEVVQEALDTATSEEEWEIVRIILERYPGLDCNELFEAVATGYEDQQELLNTIWEYADGSISLETINNSLYQATDNEKASTVRYLLDTCKASPNATGDVYGNALTAAAYDGTLDMVDMLLDAGAAIEAAEGWPLQTAAGEGHEDVVKELISRGANVNAYTTDERFPQGTALQAATEAGKVEIVKLLLEEHNADPDLGAGDLTCPIIAAARKGEGEILELIVERKAKVDLFGGPDSSTPLINAAMFMPKQYLKLLLDAGADINLADTDGDTALIMTALRGDAESVEFLLQNGADCMAVSKSRNINALQAAYEGEDRRCLQLLIDHVSKLLRSSKSGENGDGGDQDIEADSEATDHEDHESDDGAGDEEPDEEVEEEVEEEDEE